MSEVLRKYKEKTEYLENLTKTYQSLVSDMLSDFRIIVKGSEPLENELNTLIGRVKAAKNIFQIQQINRDFSLLSKKINSFIQESGKSKGGGLFGGLGSLFAGKSEPEETSRETSIEVRETSKSIDMVDSQRESLAPYVALLDEFSRGALMLADEREPFYASLKSKRMKKFQNLNASEADSLRTPLYNFFVNKTNEAGVAEREREELKNIIGLLTGYIQSLAITSDKFDSKLDEYARKVTLATEISEIIKIKSAILAETLEIQKENNSVGEQLAKANIKVREAGEKILKLEKELEMARQEKYVDALTQIYNRGYFDERIKEALIQFNRDKQPCCLLMLDVDHFKKFNDNYGHLAGDQALKVVGELIKEKVRAADTVARYGGEEFVVILYKTKIKDAFQVAEDIRSNIMKHEFGILEKTVYITVSIGLTEFAGNDTVETILKRADTGMYDAKKAGRNRTVNTAA